MAKKSINNKRIMEIVQKYVEKIFDSQDKKSSKKSNKYLRYYLIEATSSCIIHKFPFIKDFYDIKYNEVSKHQHKRALVLSARKLERLIFGLLRKNQYYIPINSVHNSNN